MCIRDRSELGPRELLALALERPRLFPPGQGWAYTGTSYQALGLLVEETTGTPLRDELRRRIFDPLELGATDLPAETWPVPGLARQYVPAENPMFPGPGPGPVDLTGLDLPFNLSLIHISEPTRLLSISYAVFCL